MTDVNISQVNIINHCIIMYSHVLIVDHIVKDDRVLDQL